MSSGVNISDLLPVPADTAVVTDPDKQEVSQTLEEEPTASHALAVADHEEKGMDSVWRRSGN